MVVISIAALVAAGCGSSSTSKTTVSSPAASTPATPSTPSTTSTAATGSHAYPAALKSGYLKSCEAKAAAATCECTLSYLEAHVPLSQFITESQEIQRTHKPSASLLQAARACKKK
jgi:hypothetical protein